MASIKVDKVIADMSKKETQDIYNSVGLKHAQIDIELKSVLQVWKNTTSVAITGYNVWFVMYDKEGHLKVRYSLRRGRDIIVKEASNLKSSEWVFAEWSIYQANPRLKQALLCCISHGFQGYIAEIGDVNDTIT